MSALLFALVGAAPAQAQSATDDPAQVEAGMAVYAGNCAGCHGADGEGSDRGRPLTGIAAQEADRMVHITSVADGKGNMPPFGDALSEDEIDAAISYVRLTFVAPEEAAAETEEAAAPAEELAVTGSSSYPIALAGATLLIAGVMLVHSGQKNAQLLRRTHPS